MRLHSVVFCVACIAVGEFIIQPAHGQISSGPAECANSTPSYLSSDQRVQLCKNGGTLETAKCANSAPSYLSSDQRVQLCKNGGTLETAKCANSAPSYLSSDQRVQLCSKN